MKFKEKRKKNKNCEISHIVRQNTLFISEKRINSDPEVYKQKQNTLFISECVEDRRFKVTWARLWVH